MSERIYNVLFLCTGNSARSILAESILRKDGRAHFRAFSAGSQPKGAVNPFAIKVLKSLDFPIDDLRSKNWEEFASPDAPAMDFVFTVCDNAAGESCPVWPGQPMTAHWGIEDPAEVEGTEIQKEAAFVAALRYLKKCAPSSPRATSLSLSPPPKAFAGSLPRRSQTTMVPGACRARVIRSVSVP